VINLGRRRGVQGFGVLVWAVIAGRAVAVQDGAPLVPTIDNLRRLTASARQQHLPILLFFSTVGCPYCAEVRRSYLAPRVQEGDAAACALIREIDIGAQRRIVDLDGAPVTQAQLARRFQVRMTPVVLLTDWHLQPLTAPLVGIDRAGFYESYLSAAIDTAQSKLPPLAR
jgi:hypothetical protein